MFELLGIFTTTVIFIACRLALFLTFLHFLWTFSEIHAKMVAILWLVMNINERVMRYQIKSGDKNE